MQKVKEIVILDHLQIDREMWQVQIDKTLEDHGVCKEDIKCIVLRADEPKPMLQTFIHEVLHALDDEYIIKLSHRQVYALEKAIYNFLEDNYLTALEECLEASSAHPTPKE